MAGGLKIHTSSVIETPEGTRCEFVFADQPDPATAKNAISIRIAMDLDDSFPLPQVIQEAALQRALNAISAEIARLKSSQARKP